MWTKLDDGILDHPKIAKVGILGFAWFAAGLVYCNRNLTDGFIPWSIARQLCSFEHVDDDSKVWTAAETCGMVGLNPDEVVSKIIARLCDAELWNEDVSRGGFQVHDFLKWNRSRAQVLKVRAKSKKWRTHNERIRNAYGTHTLSGARTRSSSRTRSSTRPVPEPEPREVPPSPLSPQSAPDIASLIDIFRSLPGVTSDPKDGGLIAGLVGKYGVDRVRRALAEAGVEIGASDSPRLFLAAVVKKRKTSAKTMRERAAEIEANLRAIP